MEWQYLPKHASECGGPGLSTSREPPCSTARRVPSVQENIEPDALLTLRRGKALSPPIDVTAVVAIVGLSLACFAVTYFQPLGVSRDYHGYDLFFDEVRADGWSVFALARFEPGFILASYLGTLVFASNLAVYSAIAALAVALKAFVIRAFSRGGFAVPVLVVLYATRWMILHELTQLRAAVAAAFVLLAFLCLQKGRKLLAIAACGAALLFHYTSVFVFPFLVLAPTKRSYFLLLIAIEFVAVFTALHVVINYAQPYVPLLESYVLNDFDNPRLLHPALLLDVGMTLLCLVLWHDLPNTMKQALFLATSGTVFYYASTAFPVFSYRIRELSSVFWIILVAQGLGESRRMRVACLLFALACSLLYVVLFLFNPTQVYFE